MNTKNEELEPVASTVSDSDLDALIRDAEETYDAAARLGNLSAASQALSVRLRGLSEKAKREASCEKQNELLDCADPLNPETWPPGLSAFVNAWTDEILRRCTVVRARQEINA